jgi:hypothetical protein
MAQTGDLLVCSMKWRTALAAGAVRAYVDGSTVTIENETGDTLDVPLTGTEVGNMYGGTRSGWLTVAPGLTVVTTAEARTA